MNIITCSPVGCGGGVLLLSLARMKQRTSSVVNANEPVAPTAIPIPIPELRWTIIRSKHDIYSLMVLVLYCGLPVTKFPLNKVSLWLLSIPCTTVDTSYCNIQNWINVFSTSVPFCLHILFMSSTIIIIIIIIIIHSTEKGVQTKEIYLTRM